MLGDRADLAVVDDVFLARVAELADGRDHGGGAHPEDLGDLAALNVGQHFGDFDALLRDRVAEVRCHLDHRFARDAGQDRAGQRGRDDVLAIGEGDVHRPDFLDVFALDPIQPEHLLIAELGDFLADEQAGGVVAAGLGLAGAAAHRAHVLVGDVDGHRVEARGEVRADRPDDDVVQVPAAGVHAERGLRGDQGGADVERGRRVRHPALLELDQLDHRFDMRLRIDFLHGHAFGRAVEARGVLPGSEEVHLAVRPAIGLGALEDFLGVVEHGRGRVEDEGLVGPDLGVVPARGGCPLLSEHAIREDLAEAEFLGQGALGKVVGKRFDRDAHTRLLLLVWSGL